MSHDPLGSPARKQLHLFLVADCSSSMSGEKIQTLNRAVKEALFELRNAQDSNPFTDVLVRSISFADGAQWHIGNPTPVRDVSWLDLQASGVTKLGAAIDLLADALTPEKMGRRNLPPVVILLSDGAPTDAWEEPLRRLNSSAWGKPGRTTRVAFAIGKDADKDVLGDFTGNPETVLDVKNPGQMVQLLKWATVTLSSYVSQGGSVAPNAQGTPLLPPPPAVSAGGQGNDDVW